MTQRAAIPSMVPPCSSLRSNFSICAARVWLASAPLLASPSLQNTERERSETELAKGGLPSSAPWLPM